MTAISLSLFGHIFALSFLAAHVQLPPPSERAALIARLPALGNDISLSPERLPRQSETGQSIIALTAPKPAATRSNRVLLNESKPEQVQDSVAAKGDALATPPMYFSNQLLERPTVPVSAPDPHRYLTGTDLPSLPIRLRLFVDNTGRVRNIDILPPEYINPERIQPVKAMFFATRFIPGKIRGIPLPSYLDIEITLSDYAR